MLIFNYGSMNSGKSALLIREAQTLKSESNHVLVWDSELDSRHKGFVSSRNKELKDIPASAFKKSTNLYSKFFMELAKRTWKITDAKAETKTILLIDEAQFLTAQQVDQLSILADFKDVDVICYGLRTDFKGHLFEGAKRLFEIADDTLCLATACERCWEKTAVFNARFVDEKLDNGAEQVLIDNDEAVKYVPLCRTCFNLVQEEN